MSRIFDDLSARYGMTLSPADVAEVLGCHQTHVRAMCADGELPAVRIGSRWFIPTAKMAELLDGATVAKEK